MKLTLKNAFLFVAALLLSQSSVFAAKEGFSFWTKTEGAYYFKSDYETGGDHFSEVVGPYDGAEIRTLLFADYTIPTPLGDHFLLRDAHLMVEGAFELTPVSVRPMLKLFFWPFPFLGFDVGGSYGTGWNIGDLHGLSVMNQQTQEYERLDPFSAFHYDCWVEGIFQFDTGVIFPGDFTHVVALINYQLIYAGLSGVKKNDVWEWQESEHQVDGLQYYFGAILAYQLPYFVYRIGVFGEFMGYFDSDDYGKFSDTYDGDFMKIEMSPFVELKFSEKTSLIILLGFNKRRSFSEEHSDVDEELFLTKTGSEWIFDRLAFRWSHDF